MEALGTSICLLFRSILLSARWAKQYRQLCREQAKNATGEVAELLVENLEQGDIIELQADQIAILQRRLKAAGIRRLSSLETPSWGPDQQRVSMIACTAWYP